MTNVSIRIRRGTQDAVFQTVALTVDGKPPDEQIFYKIAVTEGSAMSINNTTGQIKMTTHSEEGKYEMILIAELRSLRIFESSTLKVTILLREDHCSLPAKDVCFWERADYQVYENREEPTYVGHLGPGSHCQHSQTRYRLLNGTQYLEIKDAKIWTRSGEGHVLDREMTPSLTVIVLCEYKDKMLNKTLSVRVLDEDDNVPYMQTLRVSDIYVKPGEKVEYAGVCLNKIYQILRPGRRVKQTSDTDKNILQLLKTSVIFLDRDVVGDHKMTIIGDHRHILNLSQSVYSNPLTSVEGKVISCRVYTTRPANASALPYTVTLRMNNTSLLPRYGDSHVDMPLVFRTAEPHALAQSSEVTYNETSLVVTRDAAPYTRITQPVEAVSLEGLSGPVFEMNNAAFAVTKKSGIVYVKNETALKGAPNQASVTINWTHEGGSEGTVQLLITISSASCKPTVTHVNGWPSCAESKSYKNCINSCGLGVGKVKRNSISRCEWRGEKKPVDQNLSRNYSTCTPDIQTCPDGWCDPLERIKSGLCPQDCTYDLVGGNTHPTKKMGVYSGVGVCSCDAYEKCSCGPIRYRNNTVPSNPHVVMKPDFTQLTTPPPDIAAMKSVQSSKCGAICLAGIVACSVFVTGAFAVLLMACRSRFHGKGWRRERKLANSVTFNGHDATRQSTDTLLLTFDPATPTPTESNTTPANDASNSMTPDPKWEFPRERLTIEQCLGEGEFGRVLKARAVDIAGSKGYTTVAVKTLKEDARAGELGDLISEYKMLKEVCHPNVIKLLGASTIPGGPVYIIIEFAEHGSLRNYLRRSRHMGTTNNGDETSAGSTSTSSTPPTVTPRDVLSFAWQISKGMAYLTDIKLVHRDLAARNVLLATGKVCKISDFGLTRDVYEDDAYLKRSKGRVPVKWMALESLSDHVYTSKTDVWSFGVLLWELVTLGASPYPGVAVHNLFYLLRAGYRMEKPENCSDELYNIMRSCWVEDPMERPPFKQITAILEQMLADGTEYLSLDFNSRMAVNRAYFTDLPEDTIDFQMTNFNYKVPRQQPKEAQNPVARSYVNGQVTAVQYENEKVPTETTEMERYESPVRVINTTLSTQPPASYVSMTVQTTLATDS